MGKLAEQSLRERIDALDLPEASRPWTPDWQAIRIPMTFEEFLEGPLPHHRYEWENGEAVEMAAVDFSHTLIHGWYFAILNTFVDAKKLGVVTLAAYPVKLPDDGAAREPDIMFISEANRSRIQEKFVEDAADMAVEVISPGSVNHDRRTKFGEYEAAGIGEYVIIDPRKREAFFYELIDGAYVPIYPEGGVYRSVVVPGFWLEVEWLWERPPVIEIYRKLGII